MKYINAFILAMTSVNLLGENYIPQKRKTDVENIASDWCSIGGDIRKAISKCKETDA